MAEEGDRVVIRYSQSLHIVTSAIAEPSHPYSSTNIDQSIDTMVSRALTHRASKHSDQKEIVNSNSTIQEPADHRKNELANVDEGLQTFIKQQDSYGASLFQGRCVDTEAQSSVVGREQAKAYCRYSDIRYELLQSTTKFRFANRAYESIGKLAIRVPVPTYSFIEQLVDVIKGDIAFVFGWDVLDQEGIYVNSVTNQL